MVSEIRCACGCGCTANNHCEYCPGPYLPSKSAQVPIERPNGSAQTVNEADPHDAPDLVKEPRSVRASDEGIPPEDSQDRLIREWNEANPLYPVTKKWFCPFGHGWIDAPCEHVSKPVEKAARTSTGEEIRPEDL